ncbi:RNA 2',3'-cyclic phosphodiesterase [Candidatus Aminicenantes bacterium AH-873-B07]|jgi:2'-5' RNA ligase|nr:RNA 2',3'-cyclic phosphodiesterase [Candidatus Aminicenantes bacterium AH-873-B07]
MRLFIAIELSSEVKKGLMELINILKSKGEGVKWVNPENIHLTLKFLGETSPSRIQEITDSLKKSVKNFSSFYLSIKGTGCFPSEKKPPRVLWVGVEHNNYLIDFQREIEKNLKEIGFPEEERKFIPHLTLGRVKSPSRLGLIKEEHEKHKEKFFGKIKVKEIILFQSILKPEGAEYIPLARISLK